MLERLDIDSYEKVTLDIYASLNTEDLEDLADRLDNLFVSVA